MQSTEWKSISAECDGSIAECLHVTASLFQFSLVTRPADDQQNADRPTHVSFENTSGGRACAGSTGSAAAC